MVRRGDIYLVNLERGRGAEQHGQRPALVIQGDQGNEFASSTIVAVMSTAANPGFSFRVQLKPEESGLREASTVMLDQLRTLSMERLREPRIGHAAPDAMARVDDALKVSLGLF